MGICVTCGDSGGVEECRSEEFEVGGVLVILSCETNAS